MPQFYFKSSIAHLQHSWSDAISDQLATVSHNLCTRSELALSMISGRSAGRDVRHRLMAAIADSTVCTGMPVDTIASTWAAKSFGVTSSAPFSLGSTPW